MLALLRNTSKNINVLLIYSTDRLSRDLKDNLKLFREIISQIDRRVFVREGLSSDKEGFKVLFPIFAAQAHAGKINLLRNLNNGRSSKILNAKNHNGPWTPLGLTKKRKGSSPRLKKLLKTSVIFKVVW